jgi:lysophospholipase L1-like esterase
VTPVCTPASGSSFPLGSTSVTCTVIDAQRRTDSCTFSVTVNKPPRLQFTKFLAYGDSLTEGKLDPSTGTCTNLAAVHGPGLVLTSQVLPLCEFPTSYTATLRDLLHSRYSAQIFDVRNDGRGGETTGQALNPSSDFPGGRYAMSLAANHPEVLLLMQGTDDLETGSDPDTPAHNLREMVRMARGQGIRVLIATLPPLGPTHVGYPNVPITNEFIRGMAGEEGATLVDVYAALNGGPYLSSEGLHLTPEGYQKTAATFFDVIRATFDVPASGSDVGRLPSFYARSR